MLDIAVSGERLPVSGAGLILPRDKSISHRALLVAAASPGPTLISGLNTGAAVRVLIPALQTLGVGFERRGAVTVVRPHAEGLRGGRDCRLNLGPSSAAARLLLGLLAGAGVSAVVDGNENLRSQPMGWVVEPLRELGVDLRYLGAEGCLPVEVAGGRLRDGKVTMRVGSAQAVSAMLLAAFVGGRSVEIEVLTRARDHTERLLRHIGVEVRDTPRGLIVEGAGARDLGDYSIPCDPSAAAYLAAAHVFQRREGELILSDVCLNQTRIGFFELLRACGAALTYSGVREVCGEPVGSVVVGRPRELKPFQLRGAELLHSMIDEIPLACALAVFLPGRSSVFGASELTFKETNRLLSTQAMLRSFGADVEVEGENIHVNGGASPRPGVVPTFGDHRIAMTAAALACALTGRSRVLEGACYETSFPGFPEAMRALGFDVRLTPAV